MSAAGNRPAGLVLQRRVVESFIFGFHGEHEQLHMQMQAPDGLLCCAVLLGPSSSPQRCSLRCLDALMSM